MMVINSVDNSDESDLEETWEKDVIWDAEEFAKDFPELLLQQQPAYVPSENDTKESVPNVLQEQAQKLQSISTHTVKNEKKSALPMIDYNISNDIFYSSKQSDEVVDGSNFGRLQHSQLVHRLQEPFIVTHMDTQQLRNFHRPKFAPVKIKGNSSGRHKVLPLGTRIKKKALEYAKKLETGIEIRFDQPVDLSGRDGDLILVENSEENPPLLSLVGMSSKIINYHKRASSSLKKQSIVELSHGYGEPVPVNKYQNPFLGKLEPGQVISALENNLYRSPIFPHENTSTDFILIRNAMQYMIRPFSALFTAGQQCPKMEVPEPNSVKLRVFLKNFVLAHTYRMLMKCPPNSRKIRLDEILKQFPTLPETSVRGWFKSKVELQRDSKNRTWVILKPGFTLPVNAELDEMVTPEQCCTYYSLIAAKQRLEDAGHESLLSLTELEASECDKDAKRLTVPKKGEGGDDKEKKLMRGDYSALEQEILAAPWSTTATYIAAKKGRCLMQVTGFADPTGCGEGFSYVRVAKRGSTSEKKEQSKAAVNGPGGTDADLRRLSTSKAKNILMKAGIPEKELQGKSRWYIINMIRTLSTEKMKNGGGSDKITDKLMSKFGRWNKKGQSMNQERYNQDCQRVFELQNKVLSSSEVLSTDEDEDDEDATQDDYDIEEMGKNIERILNSAATTDQLTYEQEELERLELQKSMLGELKEKHSDVAKRAEQKAEEEAKRKTKNFNFLSDLIKNPGRVLKITRTVIIEGETSVRTQIVRDPHVIAAYVGIKTTKDDKYIKNFLHKQEVKFRKKVKQKQKLIRHQLEGTRELIEEKLPTLQRKRKAELETEYFPNKAAKLEAEKKLRRYFRKCTACGIVGHMKTNKNCPLYNTELAKMELKKSKGKKTAKNKKKQPATSSNNLQQCTTNGIPLEKYPLPINELSSSSSSSGSSDSDSDSDSDSSSSGTSTSASTSSKSVPDSSGSDIRINGLKMTIAKNYIGRPEPPLPPLPTLRILPLPPPPAPPIRQRRHSQAERENADYLSIRKYKTTAADRLAKC